MAEQPLLSLLFRAVRHAEGRNRHKALISRAAKHCLRCLLTLPLVARTLQQFPGRCEQKGASELLRVRAEHIEFRIGQRQYAVNLFPLNHRAELLQIFLPRVTARQLIKRLHFRALREQFRRIDIRSDDIAALFF